MLHGNDLRECIDSTYLQYTLTYEYSTVQSIKWCVQCKSLCMGAKIQVHRTSRDHWVIDPRVVHSFGSREISADPQANRRFAPDRTGRGRGSADNWGDAMAAEGWRGERRVQWSGMALHRMSAAAANECSECEVRAALSPTPWSGRVCEPHEWDEPHATPRRAARRDMESECPRRVELRRVESAVGEIEQTRRDETRRRAQSSESRVE